MRNVKQTMIVVAACATFSSAGRVAAQDWPQWRGQNRDGKAAAFRAPQSWPKALSEQWKVAVGDGVATPALVGDKLFVFSRQEGGEVTRCLEAATGKELWKDKYDAMGATGPAQPFSGPRSSPTVANGKVVTLGIRGVVSCLDAASGKVLWRKDDFKGATPRFFTSSSPLMTDGLVVVQLGGDVDGAVVAYDLASGAEKWKWSGDTPGYASPVLFTAAGTKMVIAETDKRIVGLGVTDGQRLWETPYVIQGRGYNASTPIVDGSTLIYCGSGRGATAVKVEKAGETFAAKELWKNPDNSVQFNTPVLNGGFLFGLSANNDLFCLNARDGKTAWTAPAVPPAPTPAETPATGGGRGGRGGGMRGGFGSVVDAGTVLLALTPASELIAFLPDGKSYSELARLKVGSSATYAHPVVSGNRLFAKDQDAVMLYIVQ
jgi:outer membrane protein assembly factor BamB